MSTKRSLIAAGLILGMSGVASAQEVRTRGLELDGHGNTTSRPATRSGPVTGETHGIRWEASRRIVGVASTAALATGGDPIYVAPQPQYSGVVSLVMDYGAGHSAICTGTLLPDRVSILTAAHCVSNGVGTANPLSTTAYFHNGPDPDAIVHTSPASTPVAVQSYFVHPGYTGQVIDQNDIAVLRLGAPAPAWASSYGIDFDAGLTGKDFNVAGYGPRSDVGGDFGENLEAGLLRQGNNRLDFRLGDSDFGGFFDDFFGEAQTAFSYLADFDNGLAANDASCRVAGSPGFALSGPKYCDLGRGATEVNTTDGDSGGPVFINGRLAALTSFGLTFGSTFGDVRAGLNSSFGEFSGFVPLYIHRDFINASVVPEPSTYLLLASGLLALAVVAHRRRATR